MTTEAIDELLDIARMPGKYSIKGDKFFFTTPPNKYKASEISNWNHLTDPKRWTKWRQANFEYLKEKLSGFDDGKILVDIGSGQGRFRAILARFNYIGVDFYPYPPVNVVADVTKGLPFRDNCCDIVVLSNVLEHHANPQALLKESCRILKSTGFIVGTVPFLVKVHQEPYDFLRYTNFMLGKMFAEAGFYGIDVCPIGYPIDLVESAHRRFFSQLYGSDLTGLEGKIAAVAERCIKGVLVLCKRIFLKAKRSVKFTEGYGFIARKQI